VLVNAGMARCGCNRYLEDLRILLVKSSLAALEEEIPESLSKTLSTPCAGHSLLIETDCDNRKSARRQTTRVPQMSIFTFLLGSIIIVMCFLVSIALTA